MQSASLRTKMETPKALDTLSSPLQTPVQRHANCLVPRSMDELYTLSTPSSAITAPQEADSEVAEVDSEVAEAAAEVVVEATEATLMEETSALTLMVTALKRR